MDQAPISIDCVFDRVPALVKQPQLSRVKEPHCYAILETSPVQTFRVAAESDCSERESRQTPMSKHILLVDDSETCRKVTRLFIESQFDLEVCGEAVDGLDAIEKARALKPDLVVLDLAMRRMNGLESASQLKAMMPRVPIVLFTMYSDILSHDLAMHMGADVVVSKPDGGWKLIECVQSLLQA